MATIYWRAHYAFNARFSSTLSGFKSNKTRRDSHSAVKTYYISTSIRRGVFQTKMIILMTDILSEREHDSLVLFPMLTTVFLFYF